jgi:hypothetical protein
MAGAPDDGPFEFGKSSLPRYYTMDDIAGYIVGALALGFLLGAAVASFVLL